MTGLYFLGIIMGIVTALVYRKTLFKGEAVPFVMELPNYRMPGMKNGAASVGKSKGFFAESIHGDPFGYDVHLVFCRVLIFILIWLLNQKNSILAMISSVLVPIFVPLGLGTGGYALPLSVDLWQRKVLYHRCRFFFGGAVAASIPPCSGSVSSGVQPALYTLCGSNCFHTESWAADGHWESFSFNVE